MNKSTTIAAALAITMCAASVAGYTLKPSAKVSASSISLEEIVPKSFGEWTLQPDSRAQVVNPETQQLLDKLYSQILTRTYVNKQGYPIMLSLAYGDDQRGGLQAHRPEVCYPAQGFKLGSIKDGPVSTAYGNIDARRLTTSLGQRNEPVTYWLTNGDQVVKTDFQKRVEQIRLGLTGQIPDGLLFRVSSIDTDDARGFDMQQKFVADMMASVNDQTRKQLSGLASGAASAS